MSKKIICFALLFLFSCNVEDYGEIDEDPLAYVEVESAIKSIPGNIYNPLQTDISQSRIFEIYTNGEILSTFSTKYNAKNKNRAHNVELAARTLNGTIVKSNKTFSYNDTIGPTSKKRGYKKAKVFRQGKETMSYGGGVCQVSSTLYNAVLDAGLEIVERHPHSKKVFYVEQGKDAATSHGGIDFKFKNITHNTLKINSKAENGMLSVSLEIL